MIDFTYKAYAQFLDSILDAGYRVVTVRDYLHGDRISPMVILRHDVEWDPNRALAIAHLEKSRRCRSTFYFRLDTKAFNLNVMRQLQDKGFEIGYHFNTLDRCNGDFSKAVALFEKELRQIRESGFDVTTVCSHGDPRVSKKGYKTNNEIFLKDPDLIPRNELLGEAYLNIDFSSLHYISDAGVRWNKFRSTKELISQITQNRWPVLYILVHPDYWSQSAFRAISLNIAAKFMRCFKINRAIIIGKQIYAYPLKFIRRRHK